MTKIKFKKIAITSTSKTKRIYEVASLCCEILSNKGIKILLSKNLEKIKTDGLKVISDEDIIKEADLILAVGGDGTMLSTAKVFGYHGVPVLGINLGKLGFLTDISPNELLELISEVLSGKYKVDNRGFLEAVISTKTEKFMAINEFVVHTGSIAKMIEFDVYVDEVFVYRLKADGLIVSSATGSTAYSLSGGGPIIHPNVDAISLVPIFPHSLSSSPFVVTGESVIKIVLLKTSEPIRISYDSEERTFKTKKEPITITISQSNNKLTLIHPNNHDFFEACRNKLGWGMGIVKN